MIIQFFRIIYYLSILSVLVISCTVTNKVPFRTDSLSSTGYPKKPKVPGKCYSLCFVPEEYKIQPRTYYWFSGDNNDLIGVVLKEIEYKPEKKYWIKTRNKGCVAADPIDCDVWKVSRIKPAEKKKYYVVTDTNLVKQFEPFTVDQEVLIREGYPEWREVPCSRDWSPTLVQEVQLALLKEGLGEEQEADGIWGGYWWTQLLEYQRSKKLPMGGLDYETLSSLDIE